MGTRDSVQRFKRGACTVKRIFSPLYRERALRGFGVGGNGRWFSTYHASESDQFCEKGARARQAVGISGDRARCPGSPLPSTPPASPASHTFLSAGISNLEVKFTSPKINQVTVYNSVAFRTFTVSCNHLPYQVPKETFLSAPKLSLLYPHLQLPASRHLGSASCLCGFTSSRYSI